MSLEIEFKDSHITWKHKSFDKSYLSFNNKKKRFEIINMNEENYEAIESSQWRHVYQYIIENIIYDNEITFNYMYNLPKKKIEQINKITNEWEDDKKGIKKYILLLI